MNLDETSSAWLQRKSAEFQQALARRDFRYAIDYMAMFAEMHKDASCDEQNASIELAQAYENTAFVLESSGSHPEAESFASRARSMRQRLDRITLLEMLAKPMDIPDVVLPTEGYFEILLRDIVTGLCQSSGLPREIHLWQVAVNQSWRFCAAGGELVFWLFDLESTATDATDKHRRTGRDMFLQMAKNPEFEIKPNTQGGKICEQVLCRGVLRIRRLTEAQIPQWVLIGWYLSLLHKPQSQ